MAIHPKITHLLSLPQPAQRSDEWYAARYQRLTASDAATALGQNPYESRDQLVLKKCGYGPKFMGNEATRHGQRWETHVSDLFCEKNGYKAYDAGLLLHPTIPFLGGSPDGLLSTEDGSDCALLEIKCPLYRQIKDEVPSHYMAQIHRVNPISAQPALLRIFTMRSST
jgi:putative phage-type endonuclease